MKKQFTQAIGTGVVLRGLVPDGCSLKGKRFSKSVTLGKQRDFDPDVEPSHQELGPGDEFFIHAWRCPDSSGFYDNHVVDAVSSNVMCDFPIYGNWVHGELIEGSLGANCPSAGGEIPLSWFTHNVTWKKSDNFNGRDEENRIVTPIEGDWEGAAEAILVTPL